MSDTIKGTIVGYGPGIIYIETKDGTIYSMNNSSIIRYCKDGRTECSLPCNGHFKPTRQRPASRR